MNLNEEIKKVKKIMGINENTAERQYSCAMLYFNEDILDGIGDLIGPEDLYTEEEGFGLETEPHCTLLYGLHDDEVSLEDITKVLDKYTYTTCKGHNVSCFNNPKYDVLKYDIMGDNLIDTNEELKQFPFTSNYPDYHPHMTIAYLKPGMGDKYIDKLNKEKGEIFLTPQYAVYSQPDRTKHKIPVRLD
jgi:hypothetical protein